ncbi:MAG: hypothetical protein JXR96_28765 [Deltaproteobacteria bacterium]|nr:hypothetical protein [Deltaproteobacteria bacterium]
MARNLLGIIGLLLLSIACSGSSGSPDAGTEDGDGGAGDGGGDGAQPGRFSLRVPAGAVLCSMFDAEETLPYEYDHDMQLEYQLNGRIRLREGEIDLPADRESFELGTDLAELVELGPDKLAAQPVGPAQVVRTLIGSPSEGVYRFEASQLFDLGADSVRIVWTAELDAAGQELLLDEATLSLWEKWEPVPFKLLVHYGEELDSPVRGYTSCSYAGYETFEHEIVALGGERLEMTQRSLTEGIAFCKVCPSALTAARFERGADVREQADHFRLNYTAVHHNWGQKFLIVFDEPLDDVHGLLLHEGIGTWGEVCVARHIQYLDASLEVTGEVEIESYQHSGLAGAVLCDP